MNKVNQMKILIQCGDHFENQSRVFLLAGELKRQGFCPVILMYKEGGNIFKSHDIPVIYLSKYLLKKKIKNKKYNFLTEVYDGLKIIDFINIEIKRRPELAWPSKIPKTSLSVLEHIGALDRLIQDINPDKIVIWNGFTGYVANILRVLACHKGIATAFIERGLLKDSIFIDHQGVNGNSSSTFISHFPSFQDDNLENYVSELFFNKAKMPPKTGYHLPEILKGKKIIFFPLQVQLDTNIIMYCHYNTMREVFFEIYKNLNDENVFFVIRPHPEENPDVLSNFPVYENVLISPDFSLDFWLENSDLVVTINSTVGLEALIKGKPVIGLGASIYSSLLCLSTYKNLKDDQEYILGMMRNYLGYLLMNNLIVQESKYNKYIVNKIFGSTGIENELVVKKHHFKNGVRVFIDFALSGVLNLTYRKTSESITLDWIESQVISKISQNGQYDIVLDISECNVVITDKPYEKIRFISGITYFDVYGVKLKES